MQLSEHCWLLLAFVSQLWKLISNGFVDCISLLLCMFIVHFYGVPLCCHRLPTLWYPKLCLHAISQLSRWFDNARISRLIIIVTNIFKILLPHCSKRAIEFNLYDSSISKVTISSLVTLWSDSNAASGIAFFSDSFPVSASPPSLFLSKYSRISFGSIESSSPPNALHISSFI